VDAPYYVGFRVSGVELGLDPHGHDQGQTAPVGFWEVDDIQETLKVLLDAGAEVQRAVSDVGNRQADRVGEGCGWQRHGAHADTLSCAVSR
jgi:hypothetical protein